MEKKRKEGAIDEKRETELLTLVFLRPGGHGCPRAWGRRSGVHGGSSPCKQSDMGASQGALRDTPGPAPHLSPRARTPPSELGPSWKLEGGFLPAPLSTGPGALGSMDQYSSSFREEQLHRLVMEASGPLVLEEKSCREGLASWDSPSLPGRMQAAG